MRTERYQSAIKEQKYTLCKLAPQVSMLQQCLQEIQKSQWIILEFVQPLFIYF
jgi:hypothetical protein